MPRIALLGCMEFEWNYFNVFKVSLQDMVFLNLILFFNNVFTEAENDQLDSERGSPIVVCEALAPEGLNQHNGAPARDAQG